MTKKDLVLTVGERRRAESAARDRACMQLLINRVPIRELHEQMRAKFLMSDGAIKKLLHRLKGELTELNDAELPLVKQTQVQRIHAHIAQARAAANWNAVASLERVLMQVQGTSAPVVSHVKVDATLQQSVAVVLGAMDAEQLARLISTGDLLGTASVPTAPPKVLDVQGSTVKDSVP